MPAFSPASESPWPCSAASSPSRAMWRERNHASGNITMERSRFLAKLIGPVLIAGGVGMLFNSAVYRAMFERALHDHMLIYLSGILTLPAGIAIVVLHNDWKWRWPLIVTII